MALLNRVVPGLHNGLPARGISTSAFLPAFKSHSSWPCRMGSNVGRLRQKREGIILREALVTEVAEPKVDKREEEQAVVDSHSSSSSNGNGSSNGSYSADDGIGTNAYSNNGNGIGNGASRAAEAGSSTAASTAQKPVVSEEAILGAAVAAAAAVVPAVALPAVASATTTATATATSTLSSSDEELEPALAGQLEMAAGTASSAAGQQPKLTAQGTPYANPGGRWSQFKTYSTFQRTLQIWTFAIQFAFKYFMVNRKWSYGKEGMTPTAVSAKKSELAKWLREGLVRLGPTFIKIGQQFSTRVDVLSKEFIKELEKLQDNVPPFDSDTALDIIKRSLGKPVDEVFTEFSKEPIAAASLGQVHLARLNGQQVVVKVQRPGLKELFDIDLKNIRALAVWLQKLDPKTDGAARDWVAIYDECSRILYQEIDYRLEGKNADAFRSNFKDTPWVKVPAVLWEYSSSEVLTLEYVPGKKINDAAAIDSMGLDRKRLARLAVESYLQQILRHGFFHADPHPGNVAVDDGVEGGRLIYYDFGMMGTIVPGVRGGLLELFYGVYNKDAERCLEALITMGVLVPTGGDRTAIRRTAEFFLASFQDRLQQQKSEAASKGQDYSASFKPQRSKDEAKQRRKQILSSIGEDLLLAANDQPFRFPATFTFVVRSFTVLDGIGKSLDPRFDISEISAPYARELLLEGQPQVAKLWEDFKKRASNQNRAVVNLFKGPNQIEGIANVIGRMESGDLKLRVRTLEAERALTRVQLWQQVMLSALVASTLVNVGTVLSVSALAGGATASFVGAAFFGLIMLSGLLKVKGLEKKELQLQGAA